MQKKKGRAKADNVSSSNVSITIKRNNRPYEEHYFSRIASIFNITGPHLWPFKGMDHAFYQKGYGACGFLEYNLVT